MYRRKDNKLSMIELNSETDFVAKNNEFINFAELVSKLALDNHGKIDDILNSKMENKKTVSDNLVSLISKIGEKITLRRSSFVGKNKTINFSYVHSAIKKNVGKTSII